MQPTWWQVQAVVPISPLNVDVRVNVASTRLVTWLCLRPARGTRPVTVTSSSCMVILLHVLTCRHAWCSFVWKFTTARTWTRIDRDDMWWHLRVLKDVWRILAVWKSRLDVNCECTRDDGWLIVHLFYALFQLYTYFVLSPASLNRPTLTYT